MIFNLRRGLAVKASNKSTGTQRIIKVDLKISPLHDRDTTSHCFEVVMTENVISESMLISWKIPQTLHHWPVLDSAWPFRVIRKNLPLITQANSSFPFNLHFMTTFLTLFMCQSHPRRTGESYRFLLLRRSVKTFVDKPRRLQETQAVYWKIFSGYVISYYLHFIQRTNFWCVKVEFRGWPWSEFRARAWLLVSRENKLEIKQNSEEA